MFGYLRNVSVIVPTVYGRGSTISLRAELHRRHRAGAELHLAVRQRRAILDDQHPLAGDERRPVDDDRRGRLDDLRVRVDLADVRAQRVDRRQVGRVDLVDDDHVGQPQVGLARVIGQLVAHAQRVRHHDVQVRRIERRVVVAAVPQDHVGFGLRLGEDRAVVDAGIDDGAVGDVGLVLLDLLDRALVLLEIGERGEALHLLRRQVAIGHRVPHGRDLQPDLPQARRATRRVVWLLPAPVRTAQTATTGFVLLSIVRRALEHHEVGAGGVDERGAVHHVVVGHVAVREDHLVDLERADERLQVALGMNRDAARGRARRPATAG